MYYKDIQQQFISIKKIDKAKLKNDIDPKTVIQNSIKIPDIKRSTSKSKRKPRKLKFIGSSSKLEAIKEEEIDTEDSSPLGEPKEHYKISSSSNEEFFDVKEEPDDKKKENSLVKKISKTSIEAISSAANCIAEGPHGQFLKKNLKWVSLGHRSF